jgi:hypothetical protein
MALACTTGTSQFLGTEEDDQPVVGLRAVQDRADRTTLR